MGIEGTAKYEEVNNMCYIPLDSELFIQKKDEIVKRNLVCNNDTGVIIESCSPTSQLIREKGLHEKYLGWIATEM